MHTWLRMPSEWSLNRLENKKSSPRRQRIIRASRKISTQKKKDCHQLSDIMDSMVGEIKELEIFNAGAIAELVISFYHHQQMIIHVNYII